MAAYQEGFKDGLREGILQIIEHLETYVDNIYVNDPISGQANDQLLEKLKEDFSGYL